MRNRHGRHKTTGARYNARINRDTTKCHCRAPKYHTDCFYCGYGLAALCGKCKEEGIDGPVIRGTERRVCKRHKVVT